MAATPNQRAEPRGLTTPEPLAMVGLGCRFPGGVRDLDSLGDVLTAGNDVIREVPADRWARDFHDPQSARPGTTRSHVGAFLDDIDRFDAEYFGISPREAASIDPQQRMMLEVAWEAMSDAGRPRDAWRGSRTAVFAGMLAGDYATLHAKTLGADGIGPYYASGTEFSFGAGRLAYTFDLHGPVATLNSACSSSLVAVHLAAQSLRSGECDAALAGGVSLLITPELSVFMSAIGAISPTGSCRPFDVAADGVLRGEGCGFVVLRRLHDALCDGDRIYAVIAGSAVNHDGYCMGLTVPNAAAQCAVIRSALAHAGVGTDGVDYVEAHGTGTPLGDQIELKALAEVYGAARRPERPLVVGSHKAIFGHTDAAAGMAGLLKAVWVVNNRHAPPQPHLDELIPAVDWPHAGIAIPLDGADLTGLGRPVRAGVSAFGLSGTNAHVIVSEPDQRPQLGQPTPPAQPVRRLTGAEKSQGTGPASNRPGPHILLLSAPHPEGLAEQAARMHALLARTKQARGDDDLADIESSAATRRTHQAHRRAIVAADYDGLLDQLADGGASSAGSATGVVDPDLAQEPVFVYSGQGSQWPGMTADLYGQVAAIREALDECDALIRDHVSWSLVDELRRTKRSRLGDTDRAQPAIFAVQVALTRWLLERGVQPAAVLGHSVGEIAAAHVAGCLSLHEAVRLIVYRGQVLQETAGAGRMVAVDGDQQAVQEVLAESGLAVSIAAVNGPSSIVLAGPPDGISSVTAALDRRGFRCTPLAVNYAFHSPVVAACGPRLRDLVADLAPAEPAIRMLSTTDPAADVSRPDSAYWERNLTSPVMLWPAIDRLLAEMNPALVEIGPHPVLGRALAGAVRARGRHAPVVSTLRRAEPGHLALYKTLARLHTVGVGIDWERVTGRPSRYHSLPVPSWGGGRYWLPGVRRGEQNGITRAPAGARISLLDAQGRVISEMTAGQARSPGRESAATPGGTAPLAGTGPLPAGAGPAPEAGPAVASPAEISASGSAITPHGTAAAARAGRVETLVREVLGIGPSHPLPRKRGLFEMGMDSVTAVEVRTRLEAEFSIGLPSTVVFEHPTVAELAAHVAQLVPERDAGGAAGERGDTIPAASTVSAAATGTARPGDRAIAVVGLACRLPGAASADDLWSLLADGRHAIRPMPPQRQQDPIWQEIGPDVPTSGGYLDDVAGFDAPFFRIPPREARSLDPQQRLFLEVAWEALEDAGLPTRLTRDSSVGVYLGLNTADYQQLLTRDMNNVDLYYGTGTSFAAAVGRLSYFLGIRGPSMAVDTACSASLTAVHLACQALRDGDCDAAVVGGANVIVAPTVSASMSAGGALAPDGRCKTFDEAADGYGRGEGAAVLVLKPFAAAQRDRDRIYAIIQASAVNQDGASGGLTVPSANAQVEVIRQALSRCGWEPGEVDYVEAHGTGTPLGDPIEVRALAEVYGAGRKADTPLLIGSLKANIGHLEAAAGIAGLLKVILALRREEIPPHLVTRPSSKIDWDKLPVELATSRRSWPDRGRPRRAGVSAFGFSGSNAHVLVEQAPAPPEPATAPLGLPYVLVVTAATAGALRAVAARMAERLRGADPSELDRIVHTAAFRRTWLDYRLAVTGGDAVELAGALDAVAAGGEHIRARVGTAGHGETRRVAFWFGDDLPAAEVAARLTAVPAYAKSLAACSTQLAAITGTPQDLSAQPRHELRQAYVFCHHVAATHAWSTVGIAPDAVVGAGTGEVSAAWAAGQLTLTAALRLLAGGVTDPALKPPMLTVISAAAGGPPAGHVGELARRVRTPASGASTWETCALGMAEAGVGSAVEVTLQPLPEPVADRLGLPRATDDPLDQISLSAAELFTMGCAAAGDTAGLRPVSLPAYPWSQRPYWYREMPSAETPATAIENEYLFTIKWDRVDPPAERTGGPASWAVIGRSALADELVAALRACSHAVTRLDDGSGGRQPGAWRRRLEALAAERPDCLGVVLVADRQDEPPGREDVTDQPQSHSGLLDALALGKAMAGLPQAPGRLWFITQRAQDPVANRDVDPAQCAVWEAGRVLAVEAPGRWGGLVDVVGGAADAVRALHAADPDDQVCIRGTDWYAARLARDNKPPRWRQSLAPDRWHIVLGGAAAGPAVAALVSGGARRLLLAGDAPEPPGVTAEAADLRWDRCTVGELAARLPELGNVGDVVAVASPGPTVQLAEVDEADVRGRLAEADALAGACVVASRHRPDRLTVVTGAGPSWGSVNTAAAAGAAGWLHGWACQAGGEVPTSVVGLMPRADTAELSAEHRPLFEQSGLRLLSTDETEAVLRDALLCEPGHRSAAALDLRRYVRLCQDLAPRSFLDGLSGVSPATGTKLRAELAALPATVRGEALFDHVAGAVAAELGMETSELDPEDGFFDLGMDSVMALNVRTRLEDALGLELPSTLAFEYSSTLELADYLAGLVVEQAGEQPGESVAAPPRHTRSDAQGEPAIRSSGAGARSNEGSEQSEPGADELLDALQEEMAAAEREMSAGPRAATGNSSDPRAEHTNVTR